MIPQVAVRKFNKKRFQEHPTVDAEVTHIFAKFIHNDRCIFYCLHLIPVQTGERIGSDQVAVHYCNAISTVMILYLHTRGIVKVLYCWTRITGTVLNKKYRVGIRGCSFIISYYFGPLSYCVIIWFTPTPHMYLAKNTKKRMFFRHFLSLYVYFPICYIGKIYMLYV